MGQFSIVENDKETLTVASITGAATEWAKNPTLRVFRLIPSGPPGPNAWQRGQEVLADELRAALTVRI